MEIPLKLYSFGVEKDMLRSIRDWLQSCRTEAQSASFWERSKMDATIIRCVITTLNDIEVKGKDNLDKLLGSILTLEGMARIMEQPAPEEVKKEEADG